MKFDLSKLGSREFENLTQTLALAEIGSALSVFGPGPDGGREATFDGPITLGKDGPTVDGYGVLQAKYCETLTTPQKDATWLISQIRAELKDWKTSNKRTRKPDCLIFATNVTLSGVPSTGGIDRVDKELKAQCGALGIKKWIVWHGETVNRLLEIHTKIRTSYAAWVLPGDVLAELHSQLSARKKDVGKGLQRYLAKELVRDLHVNLDQAGSADDLQIPLAEVFIDLPMGPPGGNNSGAPAHILRNLINSCDRRDSSHTADRRKGSHRRYVIVGGPGQGKSTVSQFLCQIYRARLIEGTAVGRTTEVAQAVKLITEQAARERLIPNSHRWPVKVPLTQLADDLAHGRSKSLLQFIAARASDSSDVNITPQDLREWLATFPWLLLLDGLDEVPASSNRDQVLSVINEFLMDVEEISADVTLIATTRPQGYTEEFSPSNFLHLELKPLGKERALHYAGKLATARHSADSERTSRLLHRLNQAADEVSTARLMSSPLQVTIMAVLLDRMGKAPKDRYTLFKDYYRVIYERELEKEGAATNLLRDHRADIDTIHADVGLLLQTRSERSGDTESRIAIGEFSTIIRQRLEGEGHVGASLDSLAKSISLAATDRLVFLVPSRAGEVGFEIRSLQEFWAADALMSASDVEVRDRLSLISASSHWRNVFLFAVGKIYAERRHLRDSVSAVVAELNIHAKSPQAPTRRLALGSRLALDILADGMVKAPKHEAVLVDQATKLFGLPTVNDVERLVPALSDSGLQTAKENVENWLLEGKRASESLLVFLARLAARGDAWAKTTLDAVYAGMDKAAQVSVMRLAFEVSSPKLLSVAAERLLDVPIWDLPAILSARWRRPYSRPLHIDSGPEWVTNFITAYEQPAFHEHFSASLVVGGSRVTCHIPKLRDHQIWRDINLSEVRADHWMHAVKRFNDEPSAVALAQSALAVDAAGFDLVWGSSFLPWPIVAVLQDVKDGLLSRDSLGDDSCVGEFDDWQRIESSWQEPILIDRLAQSFTASIRDCLPFIPLAASIGRSFDPPAQSGRRLVPGAHLAEILQCLSAAPGYVRSDVAQLIIGSAHAFDGVMAEKETIASLKGISEIALKGRAHVDLSWLSRARRLPDGIGAWLNQALRTTSGSAWLPHVPPSVFREWAKDFSQVELGLALCTVEAGALPRGLRVAFSREWKKVARDASIDIRHRGAICLVVSSFEPCRDEEDYFARVEVLTTAVKARALDPEYIAMQIHLSHDAIQQRFLFGFLDASPELHYEVWEVAMERLVADETSVPTKIDFSSMRAL
ncbi:NACHT domain-containing protein [Streptomyces sp. NPDC005262]|uniref:NACHT domain-containing protein n=1 Tax=Streptomyces sp. NPDC005262 TaxID=3364710 RepID=UPI0036A2B0B6